LDETEEFIVMNKPPGVHCHPLSYCERDNCLSFLREQGEKLEANRFQYDRGLLNRIDKETSGVLIYCKDHELYLRARDSFSEIVKEKIYLARVQGNCESRGLIRNGLSTKAPVVKVSKRGQRAELEILEGTYDSQTDSTILKIRLLTGLRHQIRVQLSYLGHPLMGDETYGGPKASRLFLHAYSYRLMIDAREVFYFVDPSWGDPSENPSPGTS
jgi:23S rRNA pseudouridine1911/1915/1917 synthase